MADEKVVLDPLYTETDMDAYRALRNGTAKPAEKVAEGESAGENDGETPAPGKESQEPDKPKKDRSFDGRISELTAARKKAEERAAQLEQELTEARKPRQEGRVEPKAEPKPEAKAEEGLPKLKDFTKQTEKFETYEDAHEAWVEARDAAIEKRNTAKAEQAKQEGEREKINREVGDKLKATAQKYPDFQQKIKGLDFSRMSSAMNEYIGRSPHTGEFLNYFGDNPEEYERILALPDEYQRVDELSWIRRSTFDKQSEEPPEPKKAPVTKAPPPIRSITSGGTPGKPKDLNEINDFEEYKKTRAAAKR